MKFRTQVFPIKISDFETSLSIPWNGLKYISNNRLPDLETFRKTNWKDLLCDQVEALDPPYSRDKLALAKSMTALHINVSSIANYR